ncbi:MAG TPA: hypothetical protein VKH81_16055 [Candidatus Angelobacter sp.]|nr:hypothetical protein [Candidatus Angelobacter sp.]
MLTEPVKLRGEAAIAQELTFDFAWVLLPPADGAYINTSIPTEVVDEFFTFAKRTAERGDAEEIYYLFRGAFSEAVGKPRYRSSALYFAPLDAKFAMESAANNAPVFIAAFYRACSQIAEQFGTNKAPDVATINRLLEKHRIGYVIDPPTLRLREAADVVPVSPSTLLEQAHEKFRNAVERSEQLLHENRGEEALNQIWWLLESISTAFSGLTLNGRKIEGDYFNPVIKEISQAASGCLLGGVARWLAALQAYLSGPDEGGIRHGRHLLLEGLQPHEAVLLVNLARSYISYLLAEYERLTAPSQ